MPSRKSGAHQAPEKPRSSTSLPSDQGAARSQPNEIPLFLFFHCSRGYAADLPFLSIHLILCFTTYFRPPLPLLQLILPTTSEADHDSLNIITAIVDFRSRPISKSCERCANHPPSKHPSWSGAIAVQGKTATPASCAGPISDPGASSAEPRCECHSLAGHAPRPSDDTRFDVLGTDGDWLFQLCRLS